MSDINFQIHLSPSEQKILEDKVDECGAPLVKAIEDGNPYEIAGFLTKNFHEREVARRIFEGIYNAQSEHGAWKDAHFTLSRLLELYYRDREQGSNYEIAKQICYRMIEMESTVRQAFLNEHDETVKRIRERNARYNFEQKLPKFSLPSHIGYKQLAIILEKEKRFEESRQVCYDAKLNGWNGDWDKRIRRLDKKIGD